MKKDIQGTADIKVLVDHFYGQVVKDPVIGYIFTDSIKVNWAKHLPVMYSFWENTLFYTGGYAGNPMMIHQRIHQLIQLTPEQFDQWTTLFCASVDTLFNGEKAELAKQRAVSIAAVMKIKILNSN
jgi:hemoglobin